MATLILQAAGAYLGGLFGTFGATVGTAAGALGGYLFDQALINSTQRIEGPRMTRPSPLTGEDGTALARVMGVARVSGTLIWATRLEETATRRRQGGKGIGPKVTTYSYHANFAVAICEGPVSHVRRIWADGQELDLTQHDIRIHKGSDDQLPDPLIEAKQGIGNAPAYRGTAYVVFDHFALEEFGNRIPQLQFEVIRTVGGIADKIKAVTIIPGSTEFGLSPHVVTGRLRLGETIALNRHVRFARSDWQASIDELQALCPNLQRVALVVSWFGNDLRTGECRIRPGVATANGYANDTWQVAGLDRASAPVVSQHDGKAAFGGTPDDASVIEAIMDLKARGLEVMLYPFVQMDIPAGNTLPSPFGGSGQPAYPWRGDMTCHPAPGQPATADATAAAVSQINAFAGTALPGNFSHSGKQIACTNSGDWGYRRFILHYAQLALAAGGVNGFLIGSEMRGLTRVRGVSGHPFVQTLAQLAADVRQKLGSTTKITYAADWSEYGSHVPPGSNDLLFPLDTLWANPAIDAVGIDNYMPLSDWRDTDWDGANPDGARSPDDRDALEAAIEAGEGYDWYYASQADRQNRIRTPITDGAYNKHWVYRSKDIRSWWLNAHHDRINGVEQSAATPWLAGSKPIWFTELGCPAIDKGANQPNLFPDPKSTAAGIPHFSNGGRDDGMQSAFLDAHFLHWSNPENNPVHGQTGIKMLEGDFTHVWAWDARPFPAFPVETGAWGDGANWLTGHWLNGRLANVSLGDLISTIAADHGLENVDTEGVRGCVGGYVLFGPGTAREALDPLLALYRVDASETGGVLAFHSRDIVRPVKQISDTSVTDDSHEREETIASERTKVPEIVLQFRDPLADHKITNVRSGYGGGNGDDVIDLPLALDAAEAQTIADELRLSASAGRQTLKFKTAMSMAGLVPGDRICTDSATPVFVIDRIEDAEGRVIEASRLPVINPQPRRSQLGNALPQVQPNAGPPATFFLDLPFMPNETSVTGLRVAAWMKPWQPVAVLGSPTSSGYSTRLVLDQPAITGVTVSVLPPGKPGRFDNRTPIVISLNEGDLASVDEAQVLAGSNALAVQSALDGRWEIIQFATASEIAPDVWQLERLLRGQLGTSEEALAGASGGAPVLLLDAAIRNAGLSVAEAYNGLNWQAGPAGAAFSQAMFVETITAGTVRALLPNAPVHLTAKRIEGGAIHFSFMRCGRADADGWVHPDIPLHEGTERYRLRLYSLVGQMRHEIQLADPVYDYPAQQKASDFSGEMQAIVEVAQLDSGGLPGLKRRQTFNL